MIWELSDRADPRARRLADRHYNRQKIGTKQFVPPGRCMVLYADAPTGPAFWVTSWPFAEFVRHAWPGDYVCSAFRSEGAGVASELILTALAATRATFKDGAPGMITFINRKFVRPTIVRGKPVFGWTWMKAGFEAVGETKGGLLAFRIKTENMPAPRLPRLPLLDMRVAA